MTGNRVGFPLPTRAKADVELHLTTPADEKLSLSLLAPSSRCNGDRRDRRSPRRAAHCGDRSGGLGARGG